jgi:hypothetical protein
MRVFTADEKTALEIKRRHLLNRARRMPATDADLKAAIAASTVPIQRLPVGAHRGWKPSWFGGPYNFLRDGWRAAE